VMLSCDVEVGSDQMSADYYVTSFAVPAWWLLDSSIIISIFTGLNLV
jgi:hypothetical protein